MDHGPLLRLTLHGPHCTYNEVRSPHLALHGLAAVHRISLPLPRWHLCHFLEAHSGPRTSPRAVPAPGVPPALRSSSAVSKSPVLRAWLWKVLSRPCTVTWGLLHLLTFSIVCGLVRLLTVHGFVRGGAVATGPAPLSVAGTSRSSASWKRGVWAEAAAWQSRGRGHTDLRTALPGARPLLEAPSDLALPCCWRGRPCWLWAPLPVSLFPSGTDAHWEGRQTQGKGGRPGKFPEKPGWGRGLA